MNKIKVVENILFVFTVRKASGPSRAKPTCYPSWREYSTFDTDEELTPLNAKSGSGSMCPSGQQGSGTNGGRNDPENTRRTMGSGSGNGSGGVEILSEDVKVINNLIEDLSRLDPSDNPTQRRAVSRHDTGFTVETEFQTGGPINGGGRSASIGKGSASGVLGPLRRTSLVSNNSRSSKQHQHQQSLTSTTVVPTLGEKQPGITEQVRSTTSAKHDPILFPVQPRPSHFLITHTVCTMK